MDTPDNKSLTDIIADARTEGDGYRFEVAKNWMQGRTAYGGFTAALMNAAVEKQFPDLPPLRSVMVNFTAPVSAPPLITVEVLRQGRNISTLMTRAEIDGKVVATGTFSFGQGLESTLVLDHPAAAAPDPSVSAVVGSEARKTPVPTFFHNFEMIPVEGAMPFSGAQTNRLRMWARHKEVALREGVTGLLAIADFMPPVALMRLTSLAMNSSVNWMVNFPAGVPVTRDGWWLLESDLTAAGEGYSSQVMRVWNVDRKMMIDGMQAVVVFEK